MRNERRQLGLTLTEMTVVITIAAFMVALTIPVANMLLNSFESESGAKSMINAALSNARAIAVKEQRYAGIRFQKRYDPNNPNPINVSQYIIFIVYDHDRTTLENGFRAADGVQPIKLPDSIGVTDLYVDDQQVNTDIQINEPNEVNDTTTFSIVFSPSGKLVIHDVQTRNRDGFTATGLNISNDDIFNRISQIEAGFGMFLQDDYHSSGFGKESSRNGFVIYETKILKQTPSNLRLTNYLQNLKRIYVNSYTGTIVNEK